MTEKEQIDYAEYILVNNVFYEFEIPSYMGLGDNNNHGLPNSVWEQAAKNVGFEPGNLVCVENKYTNQFYLKDK